MMHDPLNKMIMEEIGLTVDKQNRVYDQDTRQPILFKDKSMKYSSQHSVALSNNDMVFDPANNKGLMGSLFDYYTQKLEDEEGVYVAGHFEESDENGRVAVNMTVDDKQIKTNYYTNNSLSYLEAIKALNGSNDLDLTGYDSERKQQKPVTRRKKKGVLS